MNDQQQYNPYTQAPHAGENGTQPSDIPNGQRAQGQNANFQNPYAQNTQSQNPYAQNPYGQNPYNQNPYGQSPYGQYGYNQNPYAQPPYGGQKYYGNPTPYSGYTPPDDPTLLKKRKEKSILSVLGNVHGLSVIGMSVLAIVISMLLRLIPGFASVYAENSLFYLALNAAFSIVIIFVPFFLCYLYEKKRGVQKSLPLGVPSDGKAAILLVFIALLCCVAGSYASSIFSSIVENVFGITFTMPENDIVFNSVPLMLTGLLGTAVVPAFVEEFAIRGVVMQPLRKYGDKFAILMSALIFALMHGNMVQIPFAFIAGIAIGYAVITTGSMWVGVAIHFLNNLISMLMQFAIDNWTATQANITILGLLAFVLVAGVVCLLLYLKNYARPPLKRGESVLQNGEKTKAYICTVPMILAILSLLVETAQYVEF